MKPRHILAAMAAALCFVHLVSASQTAPAPAVKNESTTASAAIGVYDSRSVAVAFAGSAKFNAQVAPIAREISAARKRGDKAKTAANEQKMRDLQAQLHRQAFGTEPVTAILALYPAQVKLLMATQGLTALVSQWNEPELKRHAAARRVDVTEDLINLFEPSGHQRRSALAIRKSKPLGPEQLKKAFANENR